MENLKKMAFKYAEDKIIERIHVSVIDGYIAGYREAINKACKCYCDYICEKSRCGMCFHKYDHEQQVKSTFNYTECDDLQFIRKNLLE